MNNLWCTNYSSVRTNTIFTVLAKIQVGLLKDSMWIFLIPAGNIQAHGISFLGFIHLECFLLVFKNSPGNS